MANTYNLLIAAALERFSKQGFDAASLSQIAEDVGIKKPSIYAHFKSKEDIYLKVMHLAVEHETQHIVACLNRGKNIKEALYKHLKDMGDRFNNTSHMRFWIRAVYLPPVSLYGQIKSMLDGHMDFIEKEILNACKKLPKSRLSPEILGSAYSGIIDSLQCELLYGGYDKYKKRLSALWKVFSANIGEDVK